MGAYVMLADSAQNPHAKAGVIVYDLRRVDYGLASDDTRFTGIEHVSVTLDPNGDYPAFTVPKTGLRKIVETTDSRIKPLDLANLIRHAFMAGRGHTAEHSKLSAEDIAAYTKYDPTELPWFKRIYAVLSQKV